MESGARLGGGRYVVRGVLGEGAQGTTFDAWDEVEQRAVAIKRFDVRGAQSWKDVELAEREARVLSTLDHPLVPRYFDRFDEGDALYLVMEKVEGETLEAIRKRQGPLPEDEVRRFLACADRAMTYLHGRGAPVIHRDVKPRNVVRRGDGSYVFVDFGAVAELIVRYPGAFAGGSEQLLDLMTPLSSGKPGVYRQYLEMFDADPTRFLTPVEQQRRKRLSADGLHERHRWRDRRLMALLRHKRSAAGEIGS